MAAETRAPATRRFFQLWRLYASMDFTWMMRDLTSLLTFTLTDAIVGSASVTGTWLLAERFHGIGRWTPPQILFMLGYGLVVAGLPDIFFNYNVAYISRRVGRGQLDHTLLQPLPLWMALLTEGFSPFSAAMGLVPGLVLLVWAITNVGPVLTPGWLVLLALNLTASAIVALAFTFLWGSLAFWAPRAAEEINSASWQLLNQLKPFPLDGMWSALLGGLLTVVPIGLLAWYPARALLGIDRTRYSMFVTPVAAVVFVALAVWVFRRGLQEYGRTGSQRYLSLGHRR